MRAGGIEAGSVTLEPCRQFVDEWVTVSEQEIARAMTETYTHHGALVEGVALGQWVLALGQGW